MRSFELVGKGAILAATVVLTWLGLVVGQRFAAVPVEVGDPAPQTFVADSSFSREDTDQTEIARDEARNSVEPVYRYDSQIDALVVDGIRSFFDLVRMETDNPVVPPLDAVTFVCLPQDGSTTSSTVPPVAEVIPGGEVPVEEQGPGQSAPTTTRAPSPVVERTAGATGQVYIRTRGDGVFIPSDPSLGDIRLLACDSTGERFIDHTLSNGRYSFTGMAEGLVEIQVDTRSIPLRLTAPANVLSQRLIAFGDRDLVLEPIALEPVIESQDVQVGNLMGLGYSLSRATVSKLVQIATGDVIRGILGEEPWLASLQQGVIRLATATLETDGGILSEDLLDRQREVRTTPFLVAIPDVDPSVWEEISPVVTDVAAEFLKANKSVDQVATESERQAAANQVEPVLVTYAAGQAIVAEGEVVTQQVYDALDAGGLLFAPVRYIQLALVAVIVVGWLGIYVYRFQPSVRRSLRPMALLGLLIALSALAASGAALLADIFNPAMGYLVPAAAFGLMTAILFDARTALLMALAVGAMTAIATGDPGYTMFALLSTLLPVPFVSSISARRDLRRAAVYIVLISGVLAFAMVWFFHENMSIYQAVGFALANGAASWLVGTSLLTVFEIMFDITTSLRLLDLTDRNHPALRMLEEKAYGTFNHSLMVGTLADRAARAVGANPRLARAAAYYHDLGKTENPTLFIENQRSIHNPHDEMAPEHSAEAIRRHVSDGVVLARKYHIPSEVAESVVTHHGDAVMHFFYNKARELYGADTVDREDYRHTGRKPVRKEMAIVMMADSVEGASRAVFQAEEPTPERITQVVERVVGEKMNDGQLSESNLTLGDLTHATAAMVDALVGHYHHRISYPNFPGLPVSDPTDRK